MEQKTVFMSYSRRLQQLVGKKYEALTNFLRNGDTFFADTIDSATIQDLLQQSGFEDQFLGNGAHSVDQKRQEASYDDRRESAPGHIETSLYAKSRQDDEARSNLSIGGRSDSHVRLMQSQLQQMLKQEIRSNSRTEIQKQKLEVESSYGYSSPEQRAEKPMEGIMNLNRASERAIDRAYHPYTEMRTSEKQRWMEKKNATTGYNLI